MEDKKLISVKELAPMLGVPISWIYQRTSLGQDAIPYVRFGKYIRFDPKEVIDFFKSKESLPKK